MKNKTVDEKKKSDSKDIAKVSDKTPTKEEKYLTASVKIKNGITHCELVLSKNGGMAKSTGCKGLDAGQAVITNGMKTVEGGVNGQNAIEVAYNEYLAMMAEFKPQNIFEGMLASQMSITYIQALDCMRMAANKKEYSKIFERLQNQGIKLMRLYNYQLETLDKHRNKGRQKMTVEHVHVYKGGQAIVGEVHQGGGATNEK